MGNILFQDETHKQFFNSMLEKADRGGDVYHEAFFYLMGLTEETRRHISQMYDFKDHCLIFEGLNQGWQTGTTIMICRLAINLFNGYCGDDPRSAQHYTPYELFCCSYQRYMFEAIKLRYPEYYH